MPADRMGEGIFSNCIFFLKVNSLTLKEKKKLKNSITLNGGEVSYVLNDKCTHAVVTNPETLNSSQQKKIEKHLISVVNPDFIWKSVQEEQLGIQVERLDDNKTSEITRDGDQVDKKNQFQERRQKVTTKETLDSNLEEDMEFEDSGHDNIPDDTEVAKYSCFKKDKEYAIVELLCFSKQDPFPFKISTTCGIPNTSQKEFTFHLVDTAEKACEKYEHRINDIKNKGFTQINKVPLQAENLASKALQKVLLGEAINITELSPEVAGLVESMWVDAVGHLDAILSCPVENISLNDLSKAEGILRQVRNALVKKDKKDIYQMMQEFYRCIPHKQRRQNNINMKFLTVKQDLCQVIRDMINVCENSQSRYMPTSAAKYQALRCRIEHVDPNSEEFHQVKQGIVDNNHSNREFNILRVFRIGRMSEANNFKSDVGNVRPLLHASSPCNFVGILSRGLMLPKIIVEEFGGERTDIGNLGSGIYFSDSISTSVKYSQPSDVTGSRLLAVCDVALGKCRDVFHRDYTITEAPNGFDSVHGVQHKAGVNSDFTDDEYVVYDVNQVQMRHIVQFSTDGDYVDLQKESLYISIGQAPDHSKSFPEPSEGDVSVDDLPEQQVTKGGLKGSDGQQIPLESIHVKARLKDLAAQVVIFQTYKNNSTFPIEAKYVFPLDSTAAVCGFEAFINGKHIIGEVKEKQKAHQEYRTAISEGHGAYLMDQDAPDVFTVSVGNLPSKATVVIKITYVMELSYKYNSIDFAIPGNVAEWQQDKALKENTQDTVTKVGIGSDMSPGGSFCLDMSIEMPRKIDSISCYTHEIKIKRTECKAVVQTQEASSFNDLGFSMVISLENCYIPRMWVEKHPDQDSEACMLIFQPDIPDSFDDVFLTICLDCSNSMESCFQSAKQVALLALHSLYCRYVNIILFGSSFKEFYFFPKLYQGDKSEIEMFIKKAKPTMGSTEFWKVLQSLRLLTPKVGLHKVLLVSDGHVQNENLVFQILSKHKNAIQLFTCGVGTTANKHMLRCFAQYGSGTFEYFADKSKSRWADQMQKQNNRVSSSACTAVSVKWRQFSKNPSELLQAPTNIQALFSDDSLFVYGFVPYCTQATLKALINNEELENMVSTTELQKTTGTMLHTLTARALVKDYEDGILLEKENENEMKKQEMKSSIIQLSIEYSIMTQFTSFVAVEKRSAEEDIDIEPNVLEIISAEDVDILPYMDWSSTSDMVEHDISHHSSHDRSGSSSPVSSKNKSPYSSCEDDMGFGLFAQVAESAEVCDEKYFRTSLRRLPELEVEESNKEIEQSSDERKRNILRSLRCKRSQRRFLSRLEDERFDTEIEQSLASLNDQVEDEGCSSDSFYMEKSEDHLPRSPKPAADFSAPSRATSFLSMLQEQPVYGFGTVNLARAEKPLYLRKAQHLLQPCPPAAAPPAPAYMPISPQAIPFYGGFGAVQSCTPAAVPPDPPMSDALSMPRSRSMLGFGLSRGYSFSAKKRAQVADFAEVYDGNEGDTLFCSVAQSPRLGVTPFAGPPPPPPPIPELTKCAIKKINLSAHLSAPFEPTVWSSGEVRSSSLGMNLFAGPLPPPPPGGVRSSLLFGSAAQSQSLGVNLFGVPPPPPPPAQQAQQSQYQHMAQHETTKLLMQQLMLQRYFKQKQCQQQQQKINLLTEAVRGRATAPPARPADDFSITKKKKCSRRFMQSNLYQIKRLAPPSWSSLSSLQSQEGFWLLNEELGTVLNINVSYFTDFLVKKGITSLGARGIDSIHKLIATLLVLQVIRAHNILSEIKFKTLMKLDPSIPISLLYPNIEKAVEWAGKLDRQYPGICTRLGLGKDWDQATRQLLGLDEISATSDLYSVSEFLFL